MVKHIQAYFTEENDADAAATDLKALGAIEVTSDRTQDDVGAHLPAETAALIPIIPQNQGATIGAPFLGQPNNVLLAGFAADRDLIPDGRSREDDGARPIVTAVIEDRLYEKAVEAVKRHGGWID